MSTVITILIILITLSFIFWPYLFKRINASENISTDQSGQLLDLIDMKENMLSTIKDLEFDHDIGKLSTEDYNKMNTQYRNKAIDLMKKIELQQNSGIHEDTIGDIHVSNNKNMCAICNEYCNPGDRYCSNCGHQLILQ